MKNVWETCEFSDEIKNGDLEISKFAVELYSILDGTADKSYLDPKTFLDNTYVTDAIEIIIKDTLLRLVRNDGKPVDLLDVSFGGGKTHSLVLLYHVFKNRDLGTKFIQDNTIASKYGINEIPNAEVVAIDGRRITKNTLWGEIADRFGMFDVFKEFDEERKPTTDISKIKSLFTKPTLLMLDEMPFYLMKIKSSDPSLYTATTLFLQELASAIANTPNMRLLLTTTAEQSLLKEGTDKMKKMASLDAYNVASDMKEAVSRSADPLVPVKEKDTYGVIRKRLVKKIDTAERDMVVDTYYQYYRDNGLVPDEGYREKMLEAYPFHPFFIETLYNRVGTIGNFNKTRGMFRLLGLVLHYLQKDNIPCTLVGTGDLQLEKQPIMDDLTSKINRDFQELVQSDCIDKAEKLDRDKNERVVARIARTIYLYSLLDTAGRMSGLNLSSAKLAVGRPGVDTGLIEKSLYEEVENEFWFVKNRNGEFYFDKEPNINKIISQYKQDVRDKDMRDTMFATLKSLVTSRNGIKPVIWSPTQLGEDDAIRIFVEDYEKEYDDDAARRAMGNTLTEKPGGEIRTKMNTLVMLYPDANGVDRLKDMARTVSGIRAAEGDEGITLDKENGKVLKSRLEAAKGELEEICMQVYSKIAYPNGADVRLDQVSTMDTSHDNLTDMIVERLTKQGKMMNPGDELNHDIIQLDGVTRVEDVLAAFKKDRSRRFILENQQIFNAVTDGIREKAFGYAAEIEENDGRYAGTMGEVVDVSWSGYLIPKELVYLEQAPTVPEPGREEPSGLEPPEGPSQSTDVFKYKVKASGLDKVLEVLDRLSVLSLDADMTKKLEVEMGLNDTTITIRTDLRTPGNVQSTLKTLQSKGYGGEGIFTINSDKNIRDDLDKWGVEVEVI